MQCSTGFTVWDSCVIILLTAKRISSIAKRLPYVGGCRCRKASQVESRPKIGKELHYSIMAGVGLGRKEAGRSEVMEKVVDEGKGDRIQLRCKRFYNLTRLDTITTRGILRVEIRGSK